MAIPVMFSLMALIKVELACGMLLSNRVAQALATVTEQLVHIYAREDLRIPFDQLMVGPRPLTPPPPPPLTAIPTLHSSLLGGRAISIFSLSPQVGNLTPSHGDNSTRVGPAPPPPPPAYSPEPEVRLWFRDSAPWNDPCHQKGSF
jgi:hypothetical protein